MHSYGDSIGNYQFVGFGRFMQRYVDHPSSYGIYIVDRRYNGVEESVQQLANVKELI